MKEALVKALSAKGVRAGGLQTLKIHGLNVVRQRVSAVDTGRAGWVNDGDNVWLVRVQFHASLKDARSGRVLWSGIGEAEDVHSPRKQDLGVVIIQKRSEDHTEQAIKVAAEGVARELAP